MSDPYLTGMAWLIEHQGERERRQADARMGQFAAELTRLRRTSRRSRRGSHAAARDCGEPR